MSTTYFNNSNIKRLKNKKVSKKKDVTDVNTDNEKVVESFIPSGSIKEENPKSNIFGSSDSDKTANTINPTSVTGKQDSNTTTAASSQFNSGSILIFCIHALLSVAIAYLWGFFATNVLFLATESKNNLDYILPIDEYGEPYTKNSNKKSRWSYGFPYNLGFGRDMDATNQLDIDKQQKMITWKLWVSQSDIKADVSGLTQKGLFPALTQYLFEAVYGGLGKGGRSLIRSLLGVCAIKDKERPTTEGTWYGEDMMENKTLSKIYFFLVWPLILLFFSPLLLTFIGMVTGFATFGFGILQTHIIWGLIFSFTIGIFLSMGNGFYMAIQSIYVFFIYPWSNSNSDTKTKYRDIFQNLIPYMLFIFYIQICSWSYKDLGPSGCVGIVLIVVASIIMQYMQNKGSK